MEYGARILLCLAVLVSASGCATLGRKPVPDHIISARQLMLRGADAVQRSRWQEAEYLFAEAVELAPLDEKARGLYAESLWNRGARGSAVEHMEECVRLSAGDPVRLVRLGEMYLEQGELDKSGVAAAQAIRGDRSLAGAYALRGDVLTARGQLDDALDRYHEALNIQNDFPHVQMAIANIYHRQRRPHRALATLDRLEQRLTTEKAPYELFYLRALAQNSIGRHEAAIDAFRRCAELQPHNPDPLLRLAETHRAAGRVGDAMVAVSAALRLAPHNTGAQRLSAQLATERMRF